MLRVTVEAMGFDGPKRAIAPATPIGIRCTCRNLIINVITRRLPRKGEMTQMTTSIPQEAIESAPQTAAAKARAKRRVPATRAKAKQAPKATSAKKAPAAGRGSKTAKILDLLKRPGGVTLKELTKATGWQPHSVRGFLSGTLRKKMLVPVESFKSGDGERSYRISSK